MEQEQAVAFMIGVTSIIVGLSLAIRTSEWWGWIRLLRMQGTPAALMMGYLHLIVGTFMPYFRFPLGMAWAAAAANLAGG